MYDTQEIKIETAVIATVVSDKDKIREAEEYLDELAFLAETASIKVVKRFTQRLDHPIAGTYFGTGKLAEIKAYIEENCIDYIIFDDELSPTQMRNNQRQGRHGGNQEYGLAVPLVRIERTSVTRFINITHQHSKSPKTTAAAPFDTATGLAACLQHGIG